MGLVSFFQLGVSPAASADSSTAFSVLSCSPVCAASDAAGSDGAFSVFAPQPASMLTHSIPAMTAFHNFFPLIGNLPLKIYCCSYPFTAPIVIPFTKYFCRNG